MARISLRRSRSGGSQPTRKVADENMLMGLNSSFLAVKHKIMRNGHGEVVIMVLYVIFDGPKLFLGDLSPGT